MNDHLKSKNQLMVEKFKALTHEHPMGVLRQVISVRPTADLPLEVRKLCARLMLEETLETIQDGLGLAVRVPERPCAGDRELVTIDRVEFVSRSRAYLVTLADGLADQEVVLLGTASAFGIAQQPIFEAVMDNNCEKFGPGHSMDEGGKLVKPAGHKAPDIGALLRQQGWRDD